MYRHAMAYVRVTLSALACGVLLLYAMGCAAPDKASQRAGGDQTASPGEGTLPHSGLVVGAEGLDRAHDVLVFAVNVVTRRPEQSGEDLSGLEAHVDVMRLNLENGRAEVLCTTSGLALAPPVPGGKPRSAWFCTFRPRPELFSCYVGADGELTVKRGPALGADRFVARLFPLTRTGGSQAVLAVLEPLEVRDAPEEYTTEVIEARQAQGNGISLEWREKLRGVNPSSVRWVPEALELVYPVFSRGRPDVVSMSLRDRRRGQVDLFSLTRGWPGGIACAPTAVRFAVQPARSEPRAISILDRSGTVVSRLDVAAPPGLLLWSHSGRSIAYSSQGTTLHVVDVASGKSTQWLAVEASEGVPQALGWSNDEHTLYVATRNRIIALSSGATGVRETTLYSVAN